MGRQKWGSGSGYTFNKSTGEVKIIEGFGVGGTSTTAEMARARATIKMIFDKAYKQGRLEFPNKRDQQFQADGMITALRLVRQGRSAEDAAAMAKKMVNAALADKTNPPKSLDAFIKRLNAKPKRPAGSKDPDAYAESFKPGGVEKNTSKPTGARRTGGTRTQRSNNLMREVLETIWAKFKDISRGGKSISDQAQVESVLEQLDRKLRSTEKTGWFGLGRGRKKYPYLTPAVKSDIMVQARKILEQGR